MEEIPGSQTLRILHDRLVDDLLSKVESFTPVYPVKRSFRAVSGQAMAQSIDHTLLRQSAGKSDHVLLCKEAKDWNVWSVCIPSNRVGLAVEQLVGSPVKICTVVGFPFGYALTDAKVRETQVAVSQGANEIDMVLPLGYLKDENWQAVYEDISAVVQAAGTATVKVILETSELSLEEKILGAYIACYAGTSFLKTSTGFASGGAMIDDLHILRTIAGDYLGVKASGGIRTQEFARACLNAGADRIGASATSTILGLGGHKTSGY